MPHGSKPVKSEAMPHGSKPTWSRLWKPLIPDENQWLMWKHTKHAIYDSFPDGKAVNPGFIGLDFKDGIQVIDYESEMCWRKHKKRGTWIIQHYVVVEFEHVNKEGTTHKYWTTFSRDVDQWMWTWAEYQALP